MRQDFHGVSVTDEETRKMISECYSRHGVILEPHGAVAWKGIESYLETNGSVGQDDNFISLETAHPAKFSDEISRLLGFSLPMPHSLKGINDLTEEYSEINNDYSELRNHILKHKN
jgi:threonine synthase